MPEPLKKNSSQMVLPVMVAPAARIFATTAACVRAGGCAASHSGLPPPVRSPAMSYMSLTRAVRPARGPSALPAIGPAISCGTKKEVFIDMSFGAAPQPAWSEAQCRDGGPGLRLRRLSAVPVEDFSTVPGGDAGARKNLFEGALDMADAMRHARQIRVHRDRHELRPRRGFGIEPFELVHHAGVHLVGRMVLQRHHD